MFLDKKWKKEMTKTHGEKKRKKERKETKKGEKKDKGCKIRSVRLKNVFWGQLRTNFEPHDRALGLHDHGIGPEGT